MYKISDNMLLNRILCDAPEVDLGHVGDLVDIEERSSLNFDKILFEPSCYTDGEGFGKITLGVPIIPSYALNECEPMLRHLLGLTYGELMELKKYKAGVYLNDEGKLVYVSREDSFLEDPDRVLISGGLAVELMLTHIFDLGEYELLGASTFNTDETRRNREYALERNIFMKLTAADFALRQIPVLPKVISLAKYRAAEFGDSPICSNTYRVYRRNERRREILTKNPPLLVLDNEARMLQEAADLFFWSLDARDICFSVR